MSRRTLARAALIAVLATAVVAGGGRAGDDRPPPRRPSVRDSPGYVPLHDPDSASVVIGRRPDAPRVSRPFQGGERSLERLGHAICRGLEVASFDSLMALCVTDEEFRDILWREFPASRPATGLGWEDGWRPLSVRLMSGMNGALNDHGGRFHELVRVEADSVMRYRNFTLHSRLTLVVKNDRGDIERWGWVRAVAERKGRFKVYSTRD